MSHRDFDDPNRGWRSSSRALTGRYPPEGNYQGYGQRVDLWDDQHTSAPRQQNHRSDRERYVLPLPAIQSFITKLHNSCIAAIRAWDTAIEGVKRGLSFLEDLVRAAEDHNYNNNVRVGGAEAFWQTRSHIQQIRQNIEQGREKLRIWRRTRNGFKDRVNAGDYPLAIYMEVPLMLQQAAAWGRGEANGGAPMPM